MKPEQDPHLLNIRDELYARTGIRIAENKLPFLGRRVAKRMEELGLNRTIEFHHHLRFLETKGSEWQTFINSCTVNETYFFREFEQLEFFANELLPPVCERKTALCHRRLKIWSAGCSTGAEPYTLAIILRDLMEDADRWMIQVFGTDIDSEVLATARQGVYDTRAVQDVPEEYLDRYFSRRGQSFAVVPQIKKMVKLMPLNLMDEEAMKEFRGIDFIFCRNVLIYFDETSRQQVLERYYQALNPGGYVFLGHSESAGRFSNENKLRRLGALPIYQKPGVSR